MTEAESLLLDINPLVPALHTRGEDFGSLHPLSYDVKEFGWDGVRQSPYVCRMLKAVEYSELYCRRHALEQTVVGLEEANAAMERKCRTLEARVVPVREPQWEPSSNDLDAMRAEFRERLHGDCKPPCGICGGQGFTIVGMCDCQSE